MPEYVISIEVQAVTPGHGGVPVVIQKLSKLIDAADPDDALHSTWGDLQEMRDAGDNLVIKVTRITRVSEGASDE